MSLDAWDEVRTAYHVARLGTVSGAAEVLGVHHATVIRHIDALEGRLGSKLFQRHARGYTATEAGMDLLNVAKTTEDQFTQLAGRIRGQGEDVTGELIVTSLPGLSPLLTPMLTAFSVENPGVQINFLTEERVFRLEYGEAHLAVRAGSKPEEPDNVVQYFFKVRFALYASPSYLERHGRLIEGKWEGHKFVGGDESMSRASFMAWMNKTIPAENFAIRTSRQRTMEDAVIAGAGIGFLPEWTARHIDGLIQVLPARESWDVDVWLVTHVDLHRTAKVQALLGFLKSHIAETLEA